MQQVRYHHWLPQRNSSRRGRPGWAEPEIWFRIVHVAVDGSNATHVAAYREQTVEIALGAKGAFENGNIGTLTRQVPAERVISALPPSGLDLSALVQLPPREFRQGASHPCPAARRARPLGPSQGLCPAACVIVISLSPRSALPQADPGSGSTWACQNHRGATRGQEAAAADLALAAGLVGLGAKGNLTSFMSF